MSVFVQPLQPPNPAASAVSAPNSCQPVQPTPAASAVSAPNSCQPTPTELLQGQAQAHLCTRFAGANSGTAAVALHPADNGVAHPVAVWVYGF